MKKIILGVFLCSVILTGSVYFLYGSISPVKDISGCYKSTIGDVADLICLNKSGKYEQFSVPLDKQVGKEMYNEALWNSFTYSNDEGVFVAASLKGFQRRNSNGRIIEVKDLDVQPHKNTFGKVVFDIYDNEKGTVTYFQVPIERDIPE